MVVTDDLESVSERIEKAEYALTVQPELKPLIHPAMASRYHQTIKELKASQHLRGLIEKVVLTPEEGDKGLRIDLFGDLAGILICLWRRKI